MEMKHIFLFILTITFFSLLFFACKKEDTPSTPATVSVQSVSLDKQTASLVKGTELQLTATVKPDDATDKSVIWSSDDSSIAKVDASGKVTAVATGIATITVTTTDGGKTATCTVTVTAPVFPIDDYEDNVIVSR